MDSKNDDSFEMKDNIGSFTIKPQQLVIKENTSVKPTVSKLIKSWKCLVVIAVAILINFLLIIGMGVALFHYQTRMSYELKHLELRGVINSGQSKISNISGPPGKVAECPHCVCNVYDV